MREKTIEQKLVTAVKKHGGNVLNVGTNGKRVLLAARKDMAAQNAPSEKRTTRRKCESAHIQVSLGCARFFFALSILRSQILFCNRKSKQRLDIAVYIDWPVLLKK